MDERETMYTGSVLSLIQLVMKMATGTKVDQGEGAKKGKLRL